MTTSLYLRYRLLLAACLLLAFASCASSGATTKLKVEQRTLHTLSAVDALRVEVLRGATQRNVAGTISDAELEQIAVLGRQLDEVVLVAYRVLQSYLLGSLTIDDLDRAMTDVALRQAALVGGAR